MKGAALDNILKNFVEKLSNIQRDQSPELLERLTLSQYKNLAQADVELWIKLYNGLQSYLSDYAEILKLEVQLKQKKCALVEQMNRLTTQFDEAVNETNTINSDLKAGKIDFLNSKPTVDRSEPTDYEKSIETKKQLPLAVPNFPKRLARETAIEKPTPVECVMDSMMKPPKYCSLAMSTNKETKENTPRDIRAFSLDDSLINENEITMVNISNERRRLEFDDDDEEEMKEKPPIRRTAKASKDPICTPTMTERKPLDFYTLKPPVFTSSVGQAYNQNED